MEKWTVDAVDATTTRTRVRIGVNLTFCVDWEARLCVCSLGFMVVFSVFFCCFFFFFGGGGGVFFYYYYFFFYFFFLGGEFC